MGGGDWASRLSSPMGIENHCCISIILRNLIADDEHNGLFTYCVNHFLGAVHGENGFHIRSVNFVGFSKCIADNFAILVCFSFIISKTSPKKLDHFDQKKGYPTWPFLTHLVQ